MSTILEEQKRKGASNTQYQHAELNSVMPRTLSLSLTLKHAYITNPGVVILKMNYFI